MDTQERIKDRVLKRAARVWGYTDSELETSFDPIVAMLLEACSAELEKLSAELNNSNSRIVERLLEIMSPTSNSGSLPARSIVHATPSINNLPISLNHQFFCNKSIPNIYNPVNPSVKTIFFGPTAQFILSASELEFMTFGNTMYSLTRTVHKDVFIKSQKYLKPATVWLGIKCSDQIESLEKLMFYTEIKNTYQKEVFYHYLKQAKFFIGERQIHFKEGYNVGALDVDVEAVITKNYNKINQIYAEVNNFYADKFIHLTEDITISPDIFKTPNEIIETFGSEKLTGLDKVLWLRIEFPEAMINDILENVTFSINSFPVINKHLLKETQAIDPYINYIPLITNDHFLDLEDITDSKGSNYHLKDFSEGNLQSGNASLRDSGVVRFDERNASELIQYLLELLKDESASFSVVGGDFTKNIIKEMNQLIATLEQQTKENAFLKSNSPYIVVKTKTIIEKNTNDMFYVSFWATCGEDANDLKPGTKLSIKEGADFISDSIYLSVPSVGGKMKLSTREKILSYREALLTHGRVVTFADIKAFCLNHFKHSISNIEIRKGTKKDASLKIGFVRTIDIILTKNENTEPPLTESEWNYLCDNLIHKLNHVSSNIYPYRLILN